MATELDAPPKSVADGGELEVDKIFRQLIKHEGSDLHMQVGKAPILRVKGTLRELQMEPIDREHMQQLFGPMMDARSRKIFDENGGTDFAHVVEYEGETWRFRVNLFIQLGNWGMVARKVERWIPDFEGLYLPPAMEELCKFDQGMILLAGVTGSGKSTTIASMLNWINANYRKHVLTIEDPIEFVYTPDKCLINQREVGLDVKDEIMKFNPTVRKLILEEDDGKLVDAIRIGKDEGMQLFNESLYNFIEEEFISRAAAFEVSGSVEELKMMLKGIDVKAAAIL